jgi:phospholipase C
MLMAGLLLASCAPSQSPVAARHVFVIVMENHSPAQALTGPFTASLAAKYGVAADYSAITHPSVPNYLALTSGRTWGVTDDSYHALPAEDLGHQLTAAGVTWRAYMDGLTDRGCLDSPLPYDPGHSPFAFYAGGCPSNVVPLTELGPDLANGAPLLSWITPDDCHNTHSCDVAVGDGWLKATITLVMESEAWKSDGVLFLTWDEDDHSQGNRIPTIITGAHVTAGRYSEQLTHYRLLRTLEFRLGLAPIGASAQTTPVRDIWLR